MRFQISSILSKISSVFINYIYLLNKAFKMKISLKIMLLDVHKCFYNKKITSMIAYFAAAVKYNLARKEFRAARKFRAGSYII